MNLIHASAFRALRIFCWLIALAAVLPGGGARADDRMLVLTVDMTKEGRKVEPPTPEHPVYYVPVFLGYSERGGDQAQHFQRPPPSEDEMERALVASLARKGYLLASHEFPPTLTIAVEWGMISPLMIGNRVKNADEIRTLVLGTSVRSVSDKYAGYNREMMSVSTRHFLIISAFKYQRNAKTNPDVLLWRAHSTTDAWGNYYDEIVKTLITTAEPALGRETKAGAVWIDRPGRVIIGEAKVKEDPPAPEKTK